MLKLPASFCRGSIPLIRLWVCMHWKADLDQQTQIYGRPAKGTDLKRWSAQLAKAGLWCGTFQPNSLQQNLTIRLPGKSKMHCAPSQFLSLRRCCPGF
jgi:hypothetical protein